MQYQERLLVLTADVATRKDLPSMLHQLKQPLVEQGQHLDSDWFLIEKGQSPC
jgi:TusA-related sulfurtransferase